MQNLTLEEQIQVYTSIRDQVTNKEIFDNILGVDNYAPLRSKILLISAILRELGFVLSENTESYEYLSELTGNYRQYRGRVWTRELTDEELIEGVGQDDTDYSNPELDDILKTEPFWEEPKDYKVDSQGEPEDQTLENALFERRLQLNQTKETGDLRRAYDKIIKLENELNYYAKIKKDYELWLPAIPKVVLPRNDKKYYVDAYTFLSDVHPGKSISLGQTHGINEFNPDIAQERLAYYWRNFGKLLDRQLKTDDIDTVHIIFGGDMIENRYMHSGEASEATMSAPEEMAFMFKSCQRGIEKTLTQMRGNCNRIQITGICGNHDRVPNHRKTPHTNRVRESLAFVLYKQLEAWFEDEPLLEFVIPQGEGQIIDSFGFRTLAVHGDNVKMSRANNLLAPSRNYQENKIRPYNIDFLLMGHFHNYIFTDFFGINSSLCGPDSYATDFGFKPQLPCQSYFCVSQEYGRVVQPTPIFLN